MQSICAVEGVTAAGIKEGKFGLALIRASGTAAAVCTRNIVQAAPIQLMQRQLASGVLDGIVVNSGCANAYTGERGVADAAAMAAIAAEALGTDPSRIGVASTGVIGRYLDLDRIRGQCARIAGSLAADEAAETAAARAIMTTDLTEKHALVRREDFSIGGIVKGSGMIAPNMGTMLGFLYTDAEISAPELRAALATACRRSFNRVVVDGDTSTNDIVFCTATGRRGRPDPAAFARALEECCIVLARQIAADGEGATKLIEMRVTGAASEEDAETIARTIVESPLVKTAVYGMDPNWGRIVAAAGRAGVLFNPAILTLAIGEGSDAVLLVDRGAIVAALDRAKAAMSGKKVVFTLDLGSGGASATAWGCDLTEKYVEINGKYTT
ncbi:MAG: bifunctional ornithine acetyltransferase/N-acetylglutamate synthase [Methanomicrobiales archaeon]|nr:bifunctional ornithine acetyltransferase/N-acetylglutamate synthase [Methanomicrobiales archaeon]